MTRHLLDQRPAPGMMRLEDKEEELDANMTTLHNSDPTVGIAHKLAQEENAVNM